MKRFGMRVPLHSTPLWYIWILWYQAMTNITPAFLSTGLSIFEIFSLWWSCVWMYFMPGRADKDKAAVIHVYVTGNGIFRNGHHFLRCIISSMCGNGMYYTLCFKIKKHTFLHCIYGNSIILNLKVLKTLPNFTWKKWTFRGCGS